MTLREALEEAGCDTRSYSGRCMFGRTCLAVTFRSTAESVEATARAMAAMIEDGTGAEEAARIFKGARHDSMGLGIVVYWPDVPFDGDGGEEESDG